MNKIFFNSMKQVNVLNKRQEKDKIYSGDGGQNMEEDPHQILKRLQLLVDVYGTHKGQIPEGQNIEEDLEFVELTIKRFTDTEKLSSEIKNTTFLKPTEITTKQNERSKRSSIPCDGVGCKNEVTEADFKKLEIEADELIQQLEGKYMKVLQNLNKVDQKLLQERNKE